MAVAVGVVGQTAVLDRPRVADVRTLVKLDPRPVEQVPSDNHCGDDEQHQLNYEVNAPHGGVGFCIGIAGMKALRDDRGRRDPNGYKLQASLEAIADELAAAAGLVCGKLNRTPACVIRGFPYEPAPGRTRDLLRPAASDLFR